MQNSLLKIMTNQQLAALSVDHSRWLAVQAGAGAGKTAVLSTRFILLLESGAPLESIVAITFTRKAARELASRVQSRMVERIEELRALGAMGEVQLQRLIHAEETFHRHRIGTIDGFCRAQLSRHALDANVEPGFVLLDEKETARKRRQFTDAISRELSDLASRRESLEDGDLKRVAEAWLGLNRWMPARRLESLILLAAHDTLELPGALSSWNDFSQESDKTEYFEALQKVSKEALRKQVGPYIEEMRSAKRDAQSLLVDKPDDPKAQWVIELTDAMVAGSLSKEVCKMPKGGKIKGCYASLSGGAKRLTVIKNELLAILDQYDIDENMESLSAEGLRNFAILRPYVQRRWQEVLGHALTFGDLKERLHRFVANDEGRDAVAKDIQWLMIDEFQDTDDVQWQIFSRILAANKANLFIVGDDKQSIYRFRGAKVAVFSRARSQVAAHNASAQADYWPRHPISGKELPAEAKEPDTKISDQAKQGIITLSANFRSLAHPLRHGNRLFENLFGIKNPSNAEVRERQEYDPEPSAMNLGRFKESDQGSVTFLPIAKSESTSSVGSGDEGEEASTSFLLPDDHAEARYVVDHIRTDLVEKRGLRYGQIAVLPRKQIHVALIASVLSEAEIPFAITGGVGLYAAEVTHAFWALCASLAMPNNNFALTGLLRSSFGGISDETLSMLVRENKGKKLRSRSKTLWKALQDEDSWSSEMSPAQSRLLRGFVALLSSLHLKVGTMPFTSLLESAMLSLGVFGQDWATSAKQRNANLMELIEHAREWNNHFGNDLSAFAEELRVAIDGDGEESVGLIDDVSDAVQVMTLHQSKGKEFDAVVLPFLSQHARNDYLPMAYSFEVANTFGLKERALLGLRTADWHAAFFKEKKTPRPLGLRLIEKENAKESLAEGRRLLYVAWTRAARHLSVFVRLKFARGKKANEDPLESIPTPDSGGMGSDLLSALGLPSMADAYEPTSLDSVKALARENGFGEGLEIVELFVPPVHTLPTSDRTEQRAKAIDNFIAQGKGIALGHPSLALTNPIPTEAPSPWWHIETEGNSNYSAPNLHSLSFGRTRRAAEGLTPADRGTIVHALLESHVRQRRGGRDSFDAGALASQLELSESQILEALPELRKEAQKGIELLYAEGEPEVEFTEVGFPHAKGATLYSARLDYLSKVSDGIWRIVDFKTGAYDESYEDQVEGYAKALAMRLSAIGEEWREIQGDLLFTTGGEVRSVRRWTSSDLPVSV